MPEPKRIQRKRIPGWAMPNNTRYVGRGTRWGNPFAVQALPKSTFGPGRWTVVDLNRRMRGPVEEPQVFTDKLDARVFAVRFYELHTGPMGSYELDVDEVRRVLGGLNLACWCPEPEPGERDWCHAVHLLAVANGWDAA